MHHYILPQKGWSWLIFLDQSEALGGAIAPIASSVGRSEAPKALSESHRSLPQENPAAISFLFNNLEKSVFPDYKDFPVTADENRHWIWILYIKLHKLKGIEIPLFSDDI